LFEATEAECKYELDVVRLMPLIFLAGTRSDRRRTIGKAAMIWSNDLARDEAIIVWLERRPCINSMKRATYGSKERSVRFHTMLAVRHRPKRRRRNG